MSQPLYWIAINGSSCALSPWALREPFDVMPRPEVLIGFPTALEAAHAQKLCLYASIDAVRSAMKKWLERKDVRHIRHPIPDPPTKGPTLWSGCPAIDS